MEGVGLEQGTSLPQLAASNPTWGHLSIHISIDGTALGAILALWAQLKAFKMQPRIL